MRWTGGAASALNWQNALNSSDLASLANGSSVLSSVGDINNGTSLDIFADVSVRMTVASTTIGSGAFFGLYLYGQLDDGTSYGDAALAAGTQAAIMPAVPIIGVVPLRSAAAQTKLFGFVQGIIIPPGIFRFAFNNQSGVALSATQANCIVKYRTYDLNPSG